MSVSLPVDHGQGLDVSAIRAEFPGLSQMVHGKPLIYLDNAATTQKPNVVLDELRASYELHCANVHRGVHILSQRATDRYEAARSTVRRYLNASCDDEIIFVRGTTEAINLVAATLGRSTVKAGDEILLSGLEHHSNIVPWQMLAEAVGARIVVAPVEEDGSVSVEAFRSRLTERTRLVTVMHVSNGLGTIVPVKGIIDVAHERGVPVLVDGAQAVMHGPVDVQALGADFYAFSGHKVFGPTGIGALYGRLDWLKRLPPYQGGGDMIREVSFDGTTFAEPPSRFEAGTPNFAAAAAMGTALEWVMGWDHEAVARHEADLRDYATLRLQEIPGLRLVGTAPEKVGILSFVLEGIHPHDIGTLLDRFGIAIRTGHHCAQPLMARMGIVATSRASLALYNERGDIDALVDALQRVREMF